MVILYGLAGAFAPATVANSGEGILATSWLSIVCSFGTVLVMLAFAIMLGLHVALRIDNSRLAIGNTLGTIFFLSIGTLISIYLIIINGNSLGNQLLSFSGFLLLGIGGSGGS